MNILAIDPGCTVSSGVLYSEGCVVEHYRDLPNDEMLRLVQGGTVADTLVIEQIACYGMAVGETVFETVFWSGRFAQAWGRECHRITRHKVKMHICHSMQARDANIRQALIDKFGPPGTKKAPGGTYGISGDCWAALAVAVTFAETQITIAEETV